MMRANGIGRVVVAMLLAAGCLGVSPATDPAASPPDPNAIFDNARKAWGAGAYPRYAQYVAVVSFHNGKRFVRQSWETSEDIRQGTVYSRRFSREEIAHPFTPHGINISIPFLGNLSPQPLGDPIGQVAFAIDQDYGLAPGQRHFTSVTSSSAIDAQRSALPVIGRTGTVTHDYEVRLIETAVDEQGPEYHLALKPLRDPARYRLRELWIDGNTWLPEEAVVEGIGNRPPLTKVPWRIEFRQTEGGTYIATETALATVDYGKAGMLPDVRIAFAEVRLSSRPLSTGFGFSTGVPQGEP
jgi:hypothetical protein